MTVGELIALLEEFPPSLPVFLCPEDSSRSAVVPQKVVMNLVHPERLDVIADDCDSEDGFVDSVVVYACQDRENL